MDYAVIGGKVALIAKKRGIRGFIIDGLVRDIGEIRENKVPIFARGVIPMPGGKKNAVPVNIPIIAGGISVNPGDIIVADEEGVAVIPRDNAEEIYYQTKTNVEKEKAMSFEQWATNHKDKIDSFYR
jgi:regulator of RNase E activity RraA